MIAAQTQNAPNAMARKSVPEFLIELIISI